MPKLYRPRDGNGHLRRMAFNTKTTPEMRAKLEAAALVSGRSLSLEIEDRLERSFDREAQRAEMDTLVREAVKEAMQSALQAKAESGIAKLGFTHDKFRLLNG